MQFVWPPYYFLFFQGGGGGFGDNGLTQFNATYTCTLLTSINLFMDVACALRTTLSISAPVKFRVLFANSLRSTAESIFLNLVI